MSRPWPAGAVTGVGSLPGTDPREAMRLVLGELPDLPHLPELPGRGAGADMIGRAGTLLVDMPVEVVPSGWRLTARGGRDARVARDLLARDLDALQEIAGDHTGALKIQACGPWTLAAAVELPSGHRVVSDHGAARDLAASLAEGLRQHVADVRARVPGAAVLLQLDEPSLPAVLDGRVGTPSGWGTVRAVPANVAEQTLGDVLDVVDAGHRIVHCCASDAPLGLVRGAGADALSIDAALVDARQLDALGEAVDAGVAVFYGAVPGTDATIDAATVAVRVERFWQQLGFDRERLADTLVLAPACGMAGASPAYARRALEVLREAARRLIDPPE